MEEHREQHQEQQAGQKGGSAEAMAMHVAPAISEVAIAPGRVQWGPAFAGTVVAVAVTFLWSSLGVAIGFAMNPSGFGGELGFWITGFAGLGIFLGSALAARSAKASTAGTAILHAVVIWSLLMMLDVFTGFGVIRGLGLVALGAMEGMEVAALAISDLGWWFFGGYMFLLVAAVFGALTGMGESQEEAASG